MANEISIITNESVVRRAGMFIESWYEAIFLACRPVNGNDNFPVLMMPMCARASRGFIEPLAYSDCATSHVTGEAIVRVEAR
jgi:hypothetical protein